MRHCRHVVLTISLLAVGGTPLLSQAPTGSSSKTWIGNPQAIEDYLKTAVIVSTEELGVGVTRPRRAKLAPGGPLEALVWKPIRPGRYTGYWESYKSEIAAYELDKLLGLGMVPPTVEKRVRANSAQR